MKTYIVSVLLMLMSFGAFAGPGDKYRNKVDVQPYVGYSETKVKAYGLEGDTVGVIAGFWMDNKAAIDFMYEEDDGVDRYQVLLIGSIVQGYKQRLTWQIGASKVDVDIDIGGDIEKESETFAIAGLGYELTPVDNFTFRAQYNYYHLQDDDTTSSPHGVTLAAIYNF